MDPLYAVLTLDRQVRSGWFVGFLGALMLHGAAAAKGFTAMYPLQRFAEEVQAVVLMKLPGEVDIRFDEPEPEPEPEPEEAEPEPEPKPAAVPEQKAVEPEPAKPAAAEAAEVLTAPPDPNEPLDLTGEGFVTGTGRSYVGGTTSASGTSKKAVYNPGATGAGTPHAARGPERKVATKNLARAAMPNGTSWNDCGFPAEADIEQINFARVTLVVIVSPTGKAKEASIVKDPGYGFGPLAKRCAMRKTYTTALDASGQPITSTTPPFAVRFTR